MKHQTKIGLLTVLLMSLTMSLFFSGFFTFLVFGPSMEWLSSWARGLAIGWPLGFVIASLLGNPIRMFATRLAGPPPKA